MQVHYQDTIGSSSGKSQDPDIAWGTGEIQHLPNKFLLAGVFWTKDKELMWYSQAQQASGESEAAKTRILTRILTVGTNMKDKAARG